MTDELNCSIYSLPQNTDINQSSLNHVTLPCSNEVLGITFSLTLAHHHHYQSSRQWLTELQGWWLMFHTSMMLPRWRLDLRWCRGMRVMIVPVLPWKQSRDDAWTRCSPLFVAQLHDCQAVKSTEVSPVKIVYDQVCKASGVHEVAIVIKFPDVWDIGRWALPVELITWNYARLSSAAHHSMQLQVPERTMYYCIQQGNIETKLFHSVLLKGYHHNLEYFA